MGERVELTKGFRPRRVILALVLAAVLTALLVLEPGSQTVSLAGGPTATRENAVFYYQRIESEVDTNKFEGAYAVVTAGQGNAAGEAQAAALIKDTGAKALRYVNFYWYPAGETYQGFNISQHKNWIFCGQNGRKLFDKTTHGDEKWFFLDANERAARRAILNYLRQIKDYGYDGVFFDRGSSSFLGSRDGGNYISWKTSTCTKRKVLKRKRTFSDVFASLMRDARNKVFGDKGMILVNYGQAPYVKPKIRPNPRDKHCRQRKWAKCSSLGDVWKIVDQVIDEAPSHEGLKFFRRDMRENRTSENKYPNVLGEIKVAISDDEAFKNQVYYQWAQARLFRLNLFVNTGDNECVGSQGTCWRYGTAPDLTKVVLGRPVDGKPIKTGCDAGSNIKCLWVRRYKKGMVVVNASPSDSKNLNRSLGVAGDRLVRDVYSGVVVGCADKIENWPVLPQSGRVFVYEPPPPLPCSPV